MSSRPVDPNKCDLVVSVPGRWLQCRYSVSKSTTVKQLKQFISSDYYRVNPLRLTLVNFTPGRLMDDDQKTLAYYGIEEGRTTQIHMVIAPMSVQVRFRDYPGAAPCFVDCIEIDTVDYLRREIAMRMGERGVWPEDLVLYSGANRLGELEKRIGDYGIREKWVEVEVHKVAAGRVQGRPATSAL